MKLINKLLPRQVMKYISVFEIFAFRYGHYVSLKTRKSLDNKHQPLPWYTYPAIEYLKQFDYRDKEVFEWGCGSSSLFWAGLAKKVTSVEDNEDWYGEVYSIKRDNMVLLFKKERENYAKAIKLSACQYDIVVIDGKYRDECARLALQVVRSDGWIILDNSDRYPLICRMLRDAGFIQVDFCGFGPINGFTWATSVYMKATCSFNRHSDKITPIGGIENNNVL